MPELGDLTTSDVDALRAGSDGPTAVLVTGSCEQHGAHLPLDTDTFLPRQVALRACAATGDVVLPALPYGYNEKELDFAGTVSVPARQYLDLIVGIGDSLRRSGWPRLLVVNGHGWNNDLLRVAAHILDEHADFHAACCSYWSLCAPEVDELRESPVPGGMAHACEFETSMMLYLRPDSVRRDLIADEIGYTRMPSVHHDLLRKSAISLPERFTALSTTGVIGSPSLASADKGKAWFDAAVGRLAEFLVSFRERFPAKGAAADPARDGRERR